MYPDESLSNLSNTCLAVSMETLSRSSGADSEAATYPAAAGVEITDGAEESFNYCS